MRILIIAATITAAAFAVSVFGTGQGTAQDPCPTPTPTSTPTATPTPAPAEVFCSGTPDRTAEQRAQFSSYNATSGASFTDQADGSIQAFTPSGSGNKYARGQFEFAPAVPANSSSFCYAFNVFLPVGFHAAVQGQTGIARWDNYGAYQGNGDVGGIVIDRTTKKWHLLRGTYSGSTNEYIAGPFDIPEGRWVRVSVSQDFDSTPRNEVRVDGILVGSSTVNGDVNNRLIDRMRFGIVYVDATRQTNALTVKVDKAQVWLP